MKLECRAAETRTTGAIFRAAGPAIRKMPSPRKGARRNSKNFSRTCKLCCDCGANIPPCRAESCGTSSLTTQPMCFCARQKKSAFLWPSTIQLNPASLEFLFDDTPAKGAAGFTVLLGQAKADSIQRRSSHRRAGTIHFHFSARLNNQKLKRTFQFLRASGTVSVMQCA